MRELDRLLDELVRSAIKAGRELKRLEAADIRTAKQLELRAIRRPVLRWIEEATAMGEGLPL